MSDYNHYDDDRREDASGSSQGDGGQERRSMESPEHPDAKPTQGESRYSQSYPPLGNGNGGWSQSEQEPPSGREDHGEPTSSYKRPQRQPTYQYNPKTGWQQGYQQQPRNERDPYEWNFQDYNRLDRNRGREGAKRNRGLIVFTVSLVGVLVISLFAITGYSLLMGAPSAEDASSVGNGGLLQESLPARDAVSTADPALDLASKPHIQETIPMGGVLTIPEIAKLVSPSVVGVSAYQDGRFYEPVSVGSGIVMTEDGYIITNAHVIAGGTKYKVQLFDNTPFDAQLVGSDANTDLAILKIEVTGLTPAVFGDSNEAVVGETVVAIGNPSGIELAGSVTKGIISALNRVVSTDTYQFTYIQTDAAINPGNSGGALVNEYGQVIGINSSKIVATGYEGIGFAIPITDAKPILDDLISNGKVTGRVMLGIGCDLITEADALKYDIPMGLEIREIYDASGLKGTEVQLGDILIEIDGTRVYTLTDVQKILSEHKVGDVVTLKLYRRISTIQSTEIEVSVKLIEN